MPNHVSNRLTLHCDAATAAKVFGAIGGPPEAGEPRYLDFNALVPYPDAFDEADRTRRQWERDDPTGRHPDAPKDGYNHGGYEWCLANWGTKWNAYGQKRLSDTAIAFKTAWAAPGPILGALAAKFPGLDFTLEYADEDRGTNAGRVRYEGGVASAQPLRDEAAVRLWFDLNPDSDPREAGYDPATFEYVGTPDEDEDEDGRGTHALRAVASRGAPDASSLG